MTDLLALAQELVNITSTSKNEAAIADFVEAYLHGNEHLDVTRIGDNVIARTDLGRSRRVIVAGHLDTVPTPGITTRREGKLLFGLGAADMKGTIAVMLDLAGQLGAPRYDLTWVFYAREEITRSESGLLEIKSLRPDLLRGDVAILGEPTKAKIEAGCQGTLRVTAKLSGRSAHTARPWKGLNAIHRLGALIEDLSRLERRKVEIQGVGYAEQVEAVKIGGGHANNSVPDEAWITINYRFAPDRSIDQAIAWLSESLLSRHLNESADSLSIDDAAEGALPSLDDPVIEALLAASGGDVSAKLGWTDVATFAGLGIPAVNFGAGDPELAHHVEEYVAEADLVNVHGALKQLLS